MRRLTLICLVAMLCAESAFAQFTGKRFDRSAGDGAQAPSPPAAAPQQPDSGGDADREHPGHGHHRHGHGNSGRWNGGWGWNSGPGWNWLWPPVFVSPVFPEFGYSFTLPSTGGTSTAPAVPIAQPAAAPAPADAVPGNAPRTSSPEQKARAGRYLSYGDKLFGQQKYLAALGRYKSASAAAPDMAEAYLRQGFAYVGMGQYANAAKAFRRGLAIRSNWQGTTLRLDALYDGATAAKTQHLEKLAQAVESNPFDAELLEVLGIELFFDGQFDRAELCFSRAVQLGGDSERLLADFLPGSKPAAAPRARKVSF